MHNVAFMGKARSGKDTAAAYLVRSRSYTRLAFADPLKEMALRVDPFVYKDEDQDMWRLSEVVSGHGWEYAKDMFPEVRRILQHLGQAQREFDEDYWVNALRRKLNSAEAWNMPVVVTDVRYLNEARMLRARGFRLVRIIRDGATAGGTAAAHSSETELDTFAADLDIYNTGSLDFLYRSIESAL